MHLQCAYVRWRVRTVFLHFCHIVRWSANTFENYVPHFCKGYRKKKVKHNLYIGIIFVQNELTKKCVWQKCVWHLANENFSYNEHIRQNSSLLLYCECVICKYNFSTRDSRWVCLHFIFAYFSGDEFFLIVVKHAVYVHRNLWTTTA